MAYALRSQTTVMNGGIGTTIGMNRGANLRSSGRTKAWVSPEVNPVLDIANRTAELGVQLISSAFGKKIM